MRIQQVLSDISYGDAVSNDAIAIARVIRKKGWRTGIYAKRIDPRLPGGTAEPLDRMQFPEKEDILIYHAATKTDLNQKLPAYQCKKMMIYHNITPSSFFASYSQRYEQLQESGFQEIRSLAGKLDYCIADSAYNKKELIRMGFQCPIDVCPIVIPFGDYLAEPDQEILRQYDDNTVNLLFVGRMVPNKKIEDVIRAFYAYQRYFNSEARLFLVGASILENYDMRLRRYTEYLGIEDKVIFTGHTRFSSILAYYRLADAFVCMSEHEGFCVPLLEAMFFHVPIVAYVSSAVPETLGEGGILLDNKDPLIAAAAVDKLITDSSLRKFLRETQDNELAKYDYSSVEQQLLTILNKVVEL